MIGKKPSSLQQAAAEADQADQLIARWEAEGATARAELADLETRIGAEVLADPTTADRLTGQMSTLRARVDVADRTVAAARERAAQARRDVLEAHAADLREEARSLRHEADQRETTTGKLLAELAEHEGARFGPVGDAGPNGALTDPDMAPLTKTQRLRHRATQLDTEADRLEQQADRGTDEQVSAAAAKIPA